ncbi:MAG: S-layer homology domain-containing protein [Clostridia bacterium]|nr:S-layer homology domain-containing protein [Clostridia bacterium]
MKKIIRALVLVMAVLTALTVCVSAYDLTTFKDYDANHWANTALSHAVDNKLLGGYEDNTIRADRDITRAELATIINRAFGATIPAPVSHFKDLKTTDWYFNEIAKAVQMQTFGGTGSGIEADRGIYREEAMAVIARALVLKDGDVKVLEKYPDHNTVSDWAKGPLAALVSKAYVNGTDKNLVEPLSYVTRAQFAQIMYNIFSDYIQTPGTYSVNAERSLMINVPNVTLQNCTVNGDLVLGDGVGGGYAKITNVKVTGRILIRGGDEVTFKNVTTGEGIVVKNVNGTVNFQNYEDEDIFEGITTYTPVTYLKRTTFIPSGTTSTKYTVTWKNWDGTTLEKDTGVRKGTTPTYNGATPEKPADAQYTYTFKGWTPFVIPVIGDVTYTAVFDKTLNTYTVIWNDEDGTELEKDENVSYGTTPTFDGTEPTKTATAEFTYTFAGWTPTVSTVTGNVTYTATYTETTNTYTVIWQNWNGDELEKDENVPYGTMPEYNGATPTKPDTDEHTYTFDTWTPTVSTVTGKATYKATFIEKDREYTLDLNYGEGVFFQQAVAQEIKVTYNEKFYSKLPIENFTKSDYAFDGWYAGSTKIEANTTYADIKGATELTAKWTQTFTVKFLNGDGSEFDIQTVKIGEGATIPEGTPAKPADTDTTVYGAFIGWDLTGIDLTNIQSNLNVKPIFEETDRTYDLTLDYNGGTPADPATLTVTFNEKFYSKLPTNVTNGDKVFGGWYADTTPIAANTTYADIKDIATTLTIKWTDAEKTYTVIWNNYDGSELEKDENVAEGATPVYDGATPEKPADKKYTYTFKEWTPALSPVTSDITYTATFDETPIYYTITFVTGNGEVIDPIEDVMYEDKVTVRVDLTKDNSFFKGWRVSTDNSLVTASPFEFLYEEDITLTAEWSDVYFTVEHYIPDGNGGYTLYGEPVKVGADVGETVSAKDYAITIDGYALDETATTDTGVVTEDNTLVLKAYYRKLYTVTFYDGKSNELTAVKNLDDGDVVAEDLFPDYTSTKNGFRTGPSRTHSAVDYIYSTEYIHKISFTWAYKNAEGDFVEFTDETEIYSDVDVYPYYKKATLTLVVEKFKDIQGGEFIFQTFYDESRIVDSVKDVLWGNKGAVIQAIQHTNIESKLLEKLDSKGFITTDREILNQEARIKLVTLIGDENLDDFVKTEAEKNVSVENMEDFLENYIHDNPDEATELLLDFLHKATSHDIETIFKPAVSAFLTHDTNVLDAEVRVYIDEMCKAGNYTALNELIGVENGLYSDDMPVSHSTIMAKFETVFATEKDNIIAKIWEDEDYKKSLLMGDLYDTIVVDEIMAELDRLVEEANGTGDWSKVNALIDKFDTTIADVDSYITYVTLKNEIADKIEGFGAGSTEREAIVDEILASVTRTDVESYFNDDFAAKVNTYVNGLWTASDYEGLNAFFGVENGIFSSDMSLLGGQTAVTDVIVETIKTDADIKSLAVEKLMSLLFDGEHIIQLDYVIDLVVHDIATSTNSEIQGLITEVSVDVVKYLDNHPDKKDILVDMVVEDLYRDTIDTFTYQLRNEEKFTVHDNFSSLIAMAMYNKYNDMTIDEFIKEVNLPDAFNKVLSKDAIRDIVENIYNNALTPYIAQLKDAHDKFEADPVDNKGTYEVDTFVTVKVDPIDELVYPLYNEFKPILDEKLDDKHYYKDNPYAVALVDFLSPDILLNKMADGYDEEIYSGYTIPTAEELYNILYTVAVLADDAGKWYHDNIDKAKVDKAVDRLEDNILEYVNTLIGFINEYKEAGEIPEIDDLPDDKIRELLEKYDIQGIIDRTAQIQAIKDKIIANEKFNTVIDKFYNSKFNRPITGEDYDKAKKVLDFFFKNYQNEEFTLDELFDITLPDRFAEYKIDEDTYKVEVKGNTAEFVRDIVK